MFPDVIEVHNNNLRNKNILQTSVPTTQNDDKRVRLSSLFDKQH